MLHKIKIGIILCIITLFANTAEAASFSIVPSTGSYGIGKEVAADIKIDSEGSGINAAQATIRFPKDILNVTSIDKTDSVLNFWLEEPNFSNDTGIISFIGGTPYGVSGASLSVLHIVFTTKSAGTAPVTISDAAITASDGSGTNILSSSNNANFTVSPSSVTPTAVAPATSTPPSTTEPLVVTPPVQIIRTPAPAVKLPEKPVLNISLYPDETAWSNKTGVFNASWELPADITGVATNIDKQPVSTPRTNEGLFDNKTFPALTDGVWYLHAQFKNSNGWGTVAHYRIAVDTKAPLPFTISSSESEVSDNPSPFFYFEANDALSGIGGYRLRVDNHPWIEIGVSTDKISHHLVAQAPGQHTLVVQALDKAGNSIENTIDFEVLALPSPAFTFVSRNVFSEDSTGISLSGTAIPSTEIIVSIMNEAKIISSDTINVDAGGSWNYTFTNPLRSGTYYATIQNRDDRGAVSLQIKSENIEVTSKYAPLIATGFAILGAIIILGIVFFQHRTDRTKLRISVAERDTANVFKMIETDIQKLQDAQKTPTAADDEFIAEKLKKDVAKMGAYIRDTISRAKK